jgi:preprotein translocase subunit SecA
MFNELRERIEASIVTGIFRVQPVRNAPPPPPPPIVRQVMESGPGDPDGAGRNGGSKGKSRAPVGTGAAGAGPGAKLGRNDPCWCGSGKKYKRCHGK